jgi:hypothetical protein
MRPVENKALLAHRENAYNDFDNEGLIYISRYLKKGRQWPLAMWTGMATMMCS